MHNCCNKGWRKIQTFGCAYDRKKHHEAQQEARTHHKLIPAYDILEGDMLKKL